MPSLPGSADYELVARFTNWSNILQYLKIVSLCGRLSHLQIRPLDHARIGQKARNHADPRPTFSNRVQPIYRTAPLHAHAVRRCCATENLQPVRSVTQCPFLLDHHTARALLWCRIGFEATLLHSLTQPS